MKPENTQNQDPNKITISISEYNSLRAKDGEINMLKDQIGNLSKSISELETKKKETPKQDNSKLEEEIRNQFAEKLAQAEKIAQEYQSKYKSAVISDRVLRQLENEKLFTWAASYIKPVIERDCDIEGENIIVKDANGQPRWSEVKPNQKMDVSEYVQVLKKMQPEFFDSNARSNAGESNYNSSASNKSVISIDTLRNKTQKEINALAMKDPKAYDEMLKQLDRGL